MTVRITLIITSVKIIYNKLQNKIKEVVCMKLQKIVYGEPPKTFLAIPDHYVNVTGLYNAKANEQLLSGTVVNIADDGTVTKAVTNEKGGNGNGIVFNDTVKSDVAEKVNVTVLIHGFVRPSRLDSATKGFLNAPMIANVE